MSGLAAAFFARLETARFYRDAHAEAVALLGPGDGRLWVDVGCGAGLLARLADAAGWCVVGVDRDPAMVATARRLADPAITFRVGDLADGEPAGAAVVSAASVLIGVADRPAATAALAARLAADGVVLIVETTAALTPAAALAAVWRRRSEPGIGFLLLWALVRRGVRPVAAEDLAVAGFVVERRPIFGGLLAAHLLRRRPDTSDRPDRGATP